jgi:hypothetical protein
LPLSHENLDWWNAGVGEENDGGHKKSDGDSNEDASESVVGNAQPDTPAVAQGSEERPPKIVAVVAPASTTIVKNTLQSKRLLSVACTSIKKKKHYPLEIISDQNSRKKLGYFQSGSCYSSRKKGRKRIEVIADRRKKSFFLLVSRYEMKEPIVRKLI